MKAIISLRKRKTGLALEVSVVQRGKQLRQRSECFFGYHLLNRFCLSRKAWTRIFSYSLTAFFGHRRKSSIKHEGVRQKMCPKWVCRAYFGRAYLHYSRKKCWEEILFVNQIKKPHISRASPPAAHLCSKDWLEGKLEANQRIMISGKQSEKQCPVTSSAQKPGLYIYTLRLPKTLMAWGSHASEAWNLNRPKYVLL